MQFFPFNLRARLAILGVLLFASVPAGAGDGEAAELVMFEQPGCVWCQRFENEIAPGYAGSDEGRLAPLRRVDLKAQASAGFELATNVRITPTFVLVDGGREIGRLTGYPGKEFFWPELADLTNRLPPNPNRAPPRTSAE
ncbi:thioredoxin fold domain-containing protein [Chenggangzhangella methanolivorans]|uniref:Thioredoxin-like fold domain-containing protein n=2 Tax=Chenggangzhangella methanolivorans TaxID=1437009 RepID=A0A9E6RBY7_9HYPH|nr:thioredoxin fold domain-containing protein [Chenggangzhangella methanolivorans]QZO02009.1 hypothetical protein K6K41_12365 [Chenggangzhangella methanolivorans]